MEYATFTGTKIALIMSIMFGIFLFMTGIFLYKAAMATDSSEKKLKIRKGKESDEIMARLERVVNETEKKLREKEKLYTETGNSPPTMFVIQKSLILAFKGGQSVISFSILAFSIVLGLVSGLLILPTLGIIPAVSTVLFIILSFLTVINVVKIHYEYKVYSESVELLTLVHTQYQSVPTILEAMQRVQSVTLKGTRNNQIITDFIDRITLYNIHKVNAIDILVEDMGNIPQVKQYFNLVKKVEEIDETLKGTLNGIPENLALIGKDKKSYRDNMVIGAAYMIFAAIVYIPMLVLKYMVRSNYMTLKEMGGVGLVDVGILILILSTIISFAVTRVTEEKQWGMK